MSDRLPLATRLKLGMARAVFATGSRLAPERTAHRAARLFATPLASSRSRAQAAHADGDLRRGQLRVGEHTIATYVWGDPASQPYVLLVHGWSSFGLRFLPWVARLRAQGHAVVAFDQPGHGFSSGTLCTLPAFIDTVRAVGSHYGEAALVVAHSLGGAAAVLAQGEAWRARRCLLVAPVADLRAAARRFFRFMRLDATLETAFFAWFRQRTGIHVDELAVTPRLHAFTQPCLIVHDRDDSDVPWHEGEHYARHWPGARLLTTHGLGHHRVLEAPEVIDAALAFARGDNLADA